MSVISNEKRKRKKRNEGIYTTGEIAKICKVNAHTVARWIDSGALEGFRLPNSRDRRVRKDCLVAFLKRHGWPLGNLVKEQGPELKILALGVADHLLKSVSRAEPEWLIYESRDPISAAFDAGLIQPEAILIDLNTINRERAELFADKMRSAYAPVLISLVPSGQLRTVTWDESFFLPVDAELLAARIAGFVARRRAES